MQNGASLSKGIEMQIKYKSTIIQNASPVLPLLDFLKRFFKVYKKCNWNRVGLCVSTQVCKESEGV